MSFRVYVGYDEREALAYDVCSYSLRRHSYSFLDIAKLDLPTLRRMGLYSRGAVPGTRVDDQDRRPFSTDFAFSRFLVPALNLYQGWAVFMDCDFLWTADIHDLLSRADSTKAVQVVQHKQEASQTVKMDGVTQFAYPKKNWSSFMLFNCEHEANRTLTPSLVNSSTGSWLHNFGWLDESLIGDLHKTYNYLTTEGLAPEGALPKALHFTEGGPWFGPEHKAVPKSCYDDLWLAEYHRMVSERAR